MATVKWYKRAQMRNVRAGWGRASPLKVTGESPAPSLLKRVAAGLMHWPRAGACQVNWELTAPWRARYPSETNGFFLLLTGQRWDNTKMKCKNQSKYKGWVRIETDVAKMLGKNETKTRINPPQNSKKQNPTAVQDEGSAIKYQKPPD